ncbi:DUF1292 domain-containing protein [Paenibacillus oenotherae]|uniref:DUF1292 domain-containing protein n=1 Tax=Paenibacillus oenotherae TaxID=1435645 RepID=A0ABS7DE09_9BACL|nr:DUF1292 domain-containing protein [Paenibacillus oenotherae]
MKISKLKDVYGREVELVSEEGNTEPFRIVAEFAIGETMYAGLQSDAMRKQDEVAFFRFVISGEGEPELESIDDEEEWEVAAEAFDDLMFAGDERP